MPAPPAALLAQIRLRLAALRRSRLPGVRALLLIPLRRPSRQGRRAPPHRPDCSTGCATRCGCATTRCARSRRTWTGRGATSFSTASAIRRGSAPTPWPPSSPTWRSIVRWRPRRRTRPRRRCCSSIDRCSASSCLGWTRSSPPRTCAACRWCSRRRKCARCCTNSTARWGSSRRCSTALACACSRACGCASRMSNSSAVIPAQAMPPWPPRARPRATAPSIRSTWCAPRPGGAPSRGRSRGCPRECARSRSPAPGGRR